jgi:hypothetical protein
MIENAEARATYRTWTAMRHRCNTPKNPSFHNYGGRGIRVCAEWADSFAAFVRDMGMRPYGMCLDRYRQRRQLRAGQLPLGDLRA